MLCHRYEGALLANLLLGWGWGKAGMGAPGMPWCHSPSGEPQEVIASLHLN